MYCLANICYVCLEKKNKLISNINSSSAVNKDFIDIIAYQPFNLVWLKTKRIILICEECGLRLRETYQFLKMCHKNSALLQGYMDNLINITRENTDNEAELTVMLDLNNEHNDIHEVKCEVPDVSMHALQVEPITENTQDVFVDVEDDVIVKEEIICKEEEVDAMEEYPMDINSTEIPVNSSNAHITHTDCVSSGFTCEQVHATNEMPDESMYTLQVEPIIEDTQEESVNVEDFVVVKEEIICKEEEVDAMEEYPMDINSTEIAVNSSNAHITNTDCVSSGITCEQVHATNEKDINTASEKSCICTICSKSFVSNSVLNIHTRSHTGEKPYKCSICEKCFSQQSTLICHIRTHTGQKPFECSECGRCFKKNSDLHRHKRSHTGEKNHTCSICKKCFGQKSDLVNHVRIHTGEKNHACSICKKCFGRKSYLVSHMRTHTGKKKHTCFICKKYFGRKSDLDNHMRTHTVEKSYE